MRDLDGKLAVITGAGSGIGRALAQQLMGQGCHVALCDIHPANLRETLERCQAENPKGRTVSSFVCDVAVESQVQAFAQHVRQHHGANFINLLINNAGISGGGSFVDSSRMQWERTYNICWLGVYLMTRTFLPLLMNSREGHIVNMSSANALRAVLGGHVPHTAYSTAKFAVRGFSEALIHDFRFNAPHLNVSVVMPGHTGTQILTNSAEILGHNPPDQWTPEEVQTHRRRWQIAGVEGVQQLSDDQIRQRGVEEIENMESFGLAAEEAAQIIIEGIKANTWRILIGTDTQALDQLVRESPDTAYDPDFVERWRLATNALNETSKH